MIKSTAYGMGFGLAALGIYHGLDIGKGIAGAAKVNGIPYYEDDSVLHSKTFYGNFAKSTFGGDNLLLNIAADIGGGWAGKQIQVNAIEKAIVGRDAAARGFSYDSTSGGFTKGNRGIDFDRMRKVARNPGSRSAFNSGEAGSRTLLDKLDRAARRGAKPERLDKLYESFVKNKGSVGGIASEVESQWKLGKNIKRMSKIAAWAPLAFMAFDMVGSLSNLPSKSYPYIPRRAAGLGGTFMDTSIAATQRKRSLQAIHNSQYGGRSAFGNEASFYHQ